MVIERGDIFWADLGSLPNPDVTDHRPAKRRPVLVIQSDAYNRSRLGTVVVASITSNLAAASQPGNILLPQIETGLSRDSVVNITQLSTLNRFELELPRAGQVPVFTMAQVDQGLRALLGL
ncbi:MAG: type II toxin-antitoxin system PemK/MazF family toxin [Bifidobacteriaceae bacterium]|nr:type II toxin-antitoxin system PemK/MazF family toxin [Bifidobacteriaceae bacterium]